MMLWSQTAQQWVREGDEVFALDEWGYWLASPQRRTFVVESESGWIVRGVRADGTRVIVDRHASEVVPVGWLETDAARARLASPVAAIMRERYPEPVPAAV